MITIDGDSLTIADIFRVAGKYEKVSLDASARENIQRNRESLEKMLKGNQRLYGINTGFGKFHDVDVPKDDLISLQKNLIRSHSSGVGKPFSSEHVRAMMLVRANSLSIGYSGIRPIVVETIISALNGKVHPYVPTMGSVGASGDLAPLAHIALSLMGEGRFLGNDSGEVLKKAGITPLSLREKEGVAFINGTSTISGLLSYELSRAYRIFDAAVLSAAMSFTSLRGNQKAFLEWVVGARKQPGQSKVAAILRKILNGSKYEAMNLQDSYSLRCIPQVYGAVLDTMDYAKTVVEREINSVTDNPLVNENEVISAGNFHGEPVALVSDYLAIALTDLGNMIERRIAKIVDPNLSGLPAFLTKHEGLASGYMIPQYTAAALCNMNKVLSYPASADTIPTSANQEDHVSMGANSAIKLSKIIDNLLQIVSIELLLSAQALDLSEAVPSENVSAVYSEIRKIADTLDEDRPPYTDIEGIARELAEGKLGEKCSSFVGTAP